MLNNFISNSISINKKEYKLLYTNLSINLNKYWYMSNLFHFK